MSIRAIIADDEELARHILREYLAQQSDIEVVAECDNGFSTVKAIADLKPDLLFLDVQMPKLDGFEVLELADADLAVVFVTAYDQYATKAFDAAAVDYLLKPFDMARFQTALGRVRLRLASPPVAAMPAAELRNAALPPGRYAERIVIRDGARVHFLPVPQLDYVEAQDDYLAFHSAGKSFLKQQTISSLEQSLDPKQFVRVHRSFVVNLERIAKIEAYTKDARIAILSDGAKIPVSRAGYLKLKEVMSQP
jgi:two-component system LytT family response regulator